MDQKGTAYSSTCICMFIISNHVQTNQPWDMHINWFLMDSGTSTPPKSRCATSLLKFCWMAYRTYAGPIIIVKKWLEKFTLGLAMRYGHCNSDKWCRSKFWKSHVVPCQYVSWVSKVTKSWKVIVNSMVPPGRKFLYKERNP